jgi:hypothetical protein
MSEDLQVRRWPRYRVDLPVRVTYSQSPKIVIPWSRNRHQRGRDDALSRHGL